MDDIDEVEQLKRELKVQGDSLTALKRKLTSREEEVEALRADDKSKTQQLESLTAQLQETRARLEEKIDRLSTLIDVSSHISSTLDLNQLLDYLMASATRVMKAKDSSLMLVDEATNELVFKIALGEKGKEVQEFRLKMGQGIAGKVALEGRPIFVSDVSKDGRFESMVDQVTGFETRSIMAIPLKSRDKVIGVIEVLNAGFSGPLTDEDQEVFSAFASQAAIAIENAKLYSAVQNRMDNVLENVTDGTIVTDETGELVLVNPAAREMLGFARSAEVTLNDLRSLPCDDDLTLIIKESLDTSQVLERRVSLSGDQKRTLNVKFSPIKNSQEEKTGVVAVLKDVS